MTKEEDYGKALEEAIKYVALEHHFFNEFRRDLKILRAAIRKAVIEHSVVGIKSAVRFARYIAKAEKREQRSLHHVSELLEGLHGRIADQKAAREVEKGTGVTVENLIERLDIEAAHLVRDVSRFDGQIMRLLKDLDSRIEDNELEQAHQILMQLSEVVDDAEKWLAALSVDLDKAKSLREDFALIYHETVEEVQSSLERLDLKARADYVAYLRAHARSLPRSVNNFLRDYVDGKVSNDVAKWEFKYAYGEALKKYGGRGVIPELPEKIIISRQKINILLSTALATGNPKSVVKMLQSLDNDAR